MVKRSRAQRHSVSTNPHLFTDLEASRGAWWETEREVVAGLQWGEKKAFLLAWVRWQMLQRLSEYEEACLSLRYFEEMTYEEIGAAMEMAPSTACRMVRRAIESLREAVVEDPPWIELRTLTTEAEPENTEPEAEEPVVENDNDKI